MLVVAEWRNCCLVFDEVQILRGIRMLLGTGALQTAILKRALSAVRATVLTLHSVGVADVVVCEVFTSKQTHVEPFVSLS